MITTSKSQFKQSATAVDPYSRLIALPVHSENIFHFPDGLPAFENLKDFVFLCKPDTRPFFFMQSISVPDISFVCIDPFLVCPDYAPRISEADTKFLHINSMKDALIVTLVTVSSNVQDITTNLQGPIIVNIQACICKQIICDSQQYPVRYRIWDSLNRLDQKERESVSGSGQPTGVGVGT
jgi:flagellar assembly factor FliW